MDIDDTEESKNVVGYPKENDYILEDEKSKENEHLKRTDIKNQRISYTIEEKLKVLKEYDKIQNQRELSRRYGIPLGTLAGWIKNIYINIRKRNFIKKSI